jgi:UPF0176 protein
MIKNIAAYRFVRIDEPETLASRIRKRAESLALRGSVLVAPEGLNLFLAGDPERIDSFLADLRADPRFADLRVKISASDTLPFAKLKVKVKAEIIAFRRDGASPTENDRAPEVGPADLRRWIAQGCDDNGRRLVLVDTRNREETAYGSFEDALLLPIDNFTELPEALGAHRDALIGAAVVGFCTGGIRCEKAVLWMRANGFPEAMQLEGGILGYFEDEGGAGYRGDCFVFDDRITLDPMLRPTYGANDSMTTAMTDTSEDLQQR